MRNEDELLFDLLVWKFEELGDLLVSIFNEVVQQTLLDGEEEGELYEVEVVLDKVFVGEEEVGVYELSELIEKNFLRKRPF